MIKYYCKDCNKLISMASSRYGQGRCHKCADLEIWKSGKMKGFLGKKRPEHSKCMMGKNNPMYGKKRLDCRGSKNPMNRPEIKIKFLGKNNGNWQGGISRLPYSYDFIYNRILVLKRDNYICQKCGKKGTHVHHIDYNKQNSKLNNLITTCSKCNSEVNGNRDYWYAYFSYILKEA